MDDIKITIPPAEWARALREISNFEAVASKDIQRAITRSTYRVGGAARRNAPSSHGKLRQSIVESIKGMTGIISVNAQHAGAVEFGTRPHLIKPRRKKALAFKPGAGFRFWDESGRVVVKMVRHPGTAAQPYLRPAMQEEAPRLTKLIKNIIEDATKKNKKR
jgi:HK97 gp10 family phage protein